MLRGLCLSVVLLALLTPLAVSAEDWPEVQGRGRRSVWSETGILRQFPAEGPKVVWRTPLGGGYAGPAVAGGRVFVGDYQKREGGGVERVVALDEVTGAVLWTYENPAVDYSKFSYNNGPRATPTVDGDRVYLLGGGGDLYCVSAETGELRWKAGFVERFGAKLPTWGFSGAPLVYGEVLVCAVGGSDNARLVGLNKLTGEEVWRALPPTSDIGYSPPIVVNAAGVDQLIHWAPGEVASVNPRTGEVYWQHACENNTAVPTPVVDGDRLLISDFWRGSLMLKLTGDKPGVEVLWQSAAKSEINTEGLHALMCTPAIKGGHLYGVCSYGQLRCLDAATGARVWESMEATKEKARWANAFITQNQDVYFLNNDRGELIIADLQPGGYRELARTQLIKPDSGGAGERELGVVNWVLPAFANRHIVIRNDQEIIRVSLEQ